LPFLWQFVLTPSTGRFRQTGSLTEKRGRSMVYASATVSRTPVFSRGHGFSGCESTLLKRTRFRITLPADGDIEYYIEV